MTIITALYEDATRNPADTSDASDWASYYSLTHPVLADGSYTAHGLYFQGSQPSYVVFDRDLTIMAAGTAATMSTTTLENWILKLR